MAKGRARKSDLWDLAVNELRARGSRFRIRRRPDSAFIRIRETDGGVVKEFSAAPLRYDNDADITIARDRCLEADRLGYWPFELVASSASSDRGLSWATLAAAVASNVCERIVKEGSRTHLLNDLEKRVAALSGPVCPETLLLWVKEVDPVSARRSFDRRIETLSQIHKSGLLNLTHEIDLLRQLRPTGAA